jgi:hypothetical protein
MLDCLDEDGDVDMESYFLYCRRVEEETEEFYAELSSRCRQRQASDEPVPKRSRTRSKKKVILEFIDEHGNRVALKPEQTLWYLQ